MTETIDPLLLQDIIGTLPRWAVAREVLPPEEDEVSGWEMDVSEGELADAVRRMDKRKVPGLNGIASGPDPRGINCQEEASFHEMPQDWPLSPDMEKDYLGPYSQGGSNGGCSFGLQTYVC